MSGPGHELVEFLERTAGNSLRGVVRYTGADYERLYLRPDVAERYGESDWAAIAEELRNAEPEETRRAGLFEVGDHHVTLRLYDDSVMLHLPVGTDEGMLVSLDPEAAGDFTSFARRCLACLE